MQSWTIWEVLLAHRPRSGLVSIFLMRQSHLKRQRNDLIMMASPTSSISRGRFERETRELERLICADRFFMTAVAPRSPMPTTHFAQHHVANTRNA
jgi:hypothetical protein